MPKHIYEGLDPAGLQAHGGPNGDGTIGSGPYKLVNFTPDVSIEYEANADYHKGAPSIPKLIYALNVAPETAAAQLQTGELDMVFDLVASDFDVLDGVEGINVQRVPGIGVQFLQYATTNPLVADPRIRQAIYYAFDRKTLLETVFQGAGQLLWAPLAFDASDPELDHYDFDPDKARALIAEAQADGFDPAAPLRIIYIADEPGWGDIAAAVENDLKNVGPWASTPSSSRPTAPVGRPSCRI
jgi:ABC-type transport system substrate-binding protein